MTAQEFLAGLTGSADDFRLATEALRSSGQPFCLIGGLAVNHYVEPVVTLDADFAIAGSAGVTAALQARGFSVTEHLRTESKNSTEDRKENEGVKEAGPYIRPRHGQELTIPLRFLCFLLLKLSRSPDHLPPSAGHCDRLGFSCRSAVSFTTAVRSSWPINFSE